MENGIFGYDTNLEKCGNNYQYKYGGFQRCIVLDHYNIIKNKFQDTDYELNIVTAFNSNNTMDENNENNFKLFNILKKCNVDYIFKIVGKWNGNICYGFLCVTKNDKNFSKTFNNDIPIQWLTENNFEIYGLECPGNISTMKMFSNPNRINWYSYQLEKII